MKRKLSIRNLLIGCFSLLLLGGIGYIFLFGDNAKQTDMDDGSVSQDDLGSIEYEGQRYQYNSNLFNILFMGIDNNDELREHDLPGEAGQADSIMILSLNKETKQGTIWQIPRDTVTEIDLYDGNGNRYDSKKLPLALQYAYGSGGENSCWAVKKTVSELLYDLPIDGYLALDIASLAIINDAVGGVTLTIPEDYTEIDPAFKKGVTITLTGEQAHRYVRYRDTDESYSNQDRMQRQLQYLPALIAAVKNSVNLATGYYELFYPLVSEYMFTDMREDQVNTFADFELAEAEMFFLPGEWKTGEKYDEYHVNDEKLQKKLIETFYILKN